MTSSIRFAFRLFVLSLLAAAVAFWAGPAHADDATWNGTIDATWANLGNWGGPTTPAAVPGTGNTATFDNAGGAVDTIDLTGGVTINTILFDTFNAAAYTIGSGAVNSQPLTLDNGGAVTAGATLPWRGSMRPVSPPGPAVRRIGL
jgi:hypothetical protein